MSALIYNQNNIKRGPSLLRFYRAGRIFQSCVRKLTDGIARADRLACILSEEKIAAAVTHLHRLVLENTGELQPARK